MIANKIVKLVDKTEETSGSFIGNNDLRCLPRYCSPAFIRVRKVHRKHRCEKLVFCFGILIKELDDLDDPVFLQCNSQEIVKLFDQHYLVFELFFEDAY